MLYDNAIIKFTNKLKKIILNYGTKPPFVMQHNLIVKRMI